MAKILLRLLSLTPNMGQGHRPHHQRRSPSRNIEISTLQYIPTILELPYEGHTPYPPRPTNIVRMLSTARTVSLALGTVPVTQRSEVGI